MMICAIKQSAAIVNKELILPIDVTIADIDEGEKTYLLPYELEPVLEQLLQTKGERIKLLIQYQHKLL